MLKTLDNMAARIWKMRYAFELHRLLGLSWSGCWASAGAGLEKVDEDLEACPLEGAQEEYECWRDGG